MLIDCEQVVIDTPELRKAVYLLLRDMAGKKKTFLLRSEIEVIVEDFFQDAENEKYSDALVFDIFRYAQVACVASPWIYFSVRPLIGKWQYFRFHSEDVLFDEIDVQDYLRFEEIQVNNTSSADDFLLEIDLEPFNREFPRLKDASYIGKGVQFLNRHLSGRFFQPNNRGHEKLYEFLRLHHSKGQQLMLNNRIDSTSELRQALRKAVRIIKKKNRQTSWSE
ncbi:MAG: sucrose synthase, partial [Desulfonatronovibrionaceae bacterium]